jgi:murein DD-endopeptidase MepM/ murein hydrolase activator NlpD
VLVRRLAVLLTAVLALTHAPVTASADPGASARARLAVLAARVQDAEEREGVLADRMAGLDRRLAATERELRTIRTRFAARARAAYQHGLGADPIVVMMSTADPGTVIERLDLLNAASRRDDLLLRRGAALTRQMRAQRRDLDLARRDASAVHRALAADSAALKGLLARLGAADAAAERAASGRTRAAGKPRASRARLNGRYACLVGPTRAYRSTWGAQRSGGRRHKGTDVFAPYGSPSYAVTDGVVTRTSTSGNGGLQVYLRGNDGNEYFYAHMSRYASHAGQRVAAGEVIAYVGDSGNARGGPSHVHFEVHPGGGAPVDPYPYVRRFCG